MGVPPHLQAPAVPRRHRRQLAVRAVSEVVQDVTRDQVLGVEVGAVLEGGGGGGRTKLRVTVSDCLTHL